MVRYCVCTDQSFAELRRIASERGLGLEQLKQATGCCGGCGTCEPYVRLMLTTGRTTFPVLSPIQCRTIMAMPAPALPPPPEPTAD